MTLYINTADQAKIILALKDKGRILAAKEFLAPRRQAEKLLPEIEKLLTAAKIKWSALKKIEVANSGGTFTALRIGVVTANALGYALGIPVASAGATGAAASRKSKHFSLVRPVYDREPNLGQPRSAKVPGSI